jgi:RNA polymerase sigma-70 factor, ECF subfamily
MGSDQDGELVEALRLRRPAAAERLVATHGRRAYRWARRVIGQAADAEEAVQDALWAAIRKIDTFRGQAAFRSWLYRIVRNAAYNKLRGRRWEPDVRALDETPAPMRPPNDPAYRAELRTTLTMAIAELPAGHRAALLLRTVEGQSNREISRALGITVPTVKARVHRARVALRQRLAEYRDRAS